MATIIFWSVAGFFALIGIIVGLVKGFINVNTWAVEYLCAAALTIVLGYFMKTYVPNAAVAGFVTIGVGALLIIGFMGLSKLVKSLINRSFRKREDDMRSYGGVGVFNRLAGAFTLAVKGFTFAFIVLIGLFTVMDITGLAAIEGVNGIIGDIYANVMWTFIRPHIFDLLIVGLMFLSIRHGYTSGISSAIWTIFVIALIVGAGYVSFTSVFNTQAFAAPTQALGEQLLGSLSGIQLPEGINIDLGAIATTIAKWILVAGLFIVLLIMILLLSFFVPRLITNARFGSAYYIVDGILGGLILFSIVLGGIMLVGNVFSVISDLEFMYPFSKYFEGSTVATWFYDNNILGALGVPNFPQLREWLT